MRKKIVFADGVSGRKRMKKESVSLSEIDGDTLFVLVRLAAHISQGCDTESCAVNATDGQREGDVFKMFRKLTVIIVGTI